MLSIIKNDWNRLMQQKMYLCVAVGLTILSIAAAILLTNKVVAKSNLAVVGKADTIKETEYFSITYLDKAPEKSKLVENRYDAVILAKEDGSFEIETIKSDDFKKQLLTALKDPEAYGSGRQQEQRQIGTNIFGYMMMFLLMQGALYAKLYAEDKEKHVAERILVSSIPFRKYMMGHGLFIGVLIFIPSFGAVVAARLLGVSIGFSLLQYALLIGVLSFLSMAFALCVSSFFKVSDTSNMIASATIVLTSVLAGSFYSMTKSGSIFNKLIHVLPQKDLLSFADAWEKGILNSTKQLELFYVILIAAIFLVVAIVKTRKDYIYSRSE
ncbi:MAG: ABC transporter permease [bacterium]|nr:ABC transporter permease [bacterium]